MPVPPAGAEGALAAIWTALGGDADHLGAIEITGAGDWPSVFAVTPLACGSIGGAALAAAELVAARRAGALPPVTVDRRLASLWFGQTLAPEGWTVPPSWDPVAGDYAARDGWIRLHTNAPHHRDAALSVLGVAADSVAADRAAVAAAVAGWQACALETAVVAAGGCAAAMHDAAAWATHPQGAAVAGEPLIWQDAGGDAHPLPAVAADRPLAGVTVLDLTRVLAGPVATRFLAGLGADVLRVDPPDWDEPGLAPEIMLGKRAIRLDLRSAPGRNRLEALIRDADIMVHGYRPGALDGLGFGTERRRAINPGLVDVALCAYGWTGPWAGRRGFDSLVQMSSGIAAAGMGWAGKAVPTPLPVQALDHAAGYVMAAAALRGLTCRHLTGRGSGWRTSLARVARLLAGLDAGAPTGPLHPPGPADHAPAIEATAWGPARRLRPPVTLDGHALRWDRPAGPLGAADAASP